jgi:hypothetical protein
MENSKAICTGGVVYDYAEAISKIGFWFPVERHGICDKIKAAVLR